MILIKILPIILVLGLFYKTIYPQETEVIIDSKLTFKEALGNKEIPDEIKNNQKLVDVFYYSFDNNLHKGQIVIHKDLAKDIVEIFELIKEKKFPIEKVIPIIKYNWNDDKSMEDNNTSGFNYRKIAGTNRLSNHAYGRAIDINPLLNPYIKGSHISPANATYNSSEEGTIIENSFLVKEFKKRGWEWGGNWKTRKDYQHFEKD